jgi:hypothetical protein
MVGETNLDVLLKSLSADLIEGVFVFATVAEVPSGISARMIFEEAEGTTLIVLRSEAEAHGLPFEFPSRMITLNIHSSLEAVGFMARIATELAKEGMGVNPVAGFYHDHLFVPEDRADDAMDVLAQIARES